MYTFWDLICDNPSISWDIDGISNNPNVLYYKYLNRAHVDASKISANPNITWENIRDNPKIAWNWENISRNPNITPTIIKNSNYHNDKKSIWHYSILSDNKMDQPYYRSKHYKKQLANKLASTIIDELRVVVYHPRRHPANHTALCDLVDHPFEFLKQDDLHNI